MPKLKPTERAFYQHVGSRIRQLRLSAKGQPINQAQLARELGVKQNTISRWESGSFRPTMLDAQAIAQFFNVPVGSLYLDDEDRSLTGRVKTVLQELSERDNFEMLMLIKL